MSASKKQSTVINKSTGAVLRIIDVCLLTETFCGVVVNMGRSSFLPGQEVKHCLMTAYEPISLADGRTSSPNLFARDV